MGKNKVIQLKFRTINHNIFEAIKKGEKKIETRAATEKYWSLKKGDRVVLICGRQKIMKKVSKVEVFKTISAILKKYSPQEINPYTKTTKEARAMWHSFPGYKEKIKKNGLLVMHLK